MSAGDALYEVVQLGLELRDGARELLALLALLRYDSLGCLGQETGVLERAHDTRDLLLGLVQLLLGVFKLTFQIEDLIVAVFAADPEKDKEKAEDPRNEEIPDVIVVRIKEDKVTINGHEVANQEELRKYVEEYNSDTRTFVLEEEQSILETYNWVKAVFDELDIQLKNSK